MSQSALGNRTSIALRRLGIGLLGITTAGAIYVVALAAGNSPDTTYVARSDWLLGVAVVTGVTLLIVGSIASIEQADRVTGPLLLGLGLTWLAPEVAGWAAGPTWMHGLALWTAVMFLPLLIHLALQYPQAAILNRIDHRMVRLSYAVGGAVVLAGTALYNSFFDLYCWRSCRPNPLAVLATPESTRLVANAYPWILVAFGIVFVIRLLARMYRDVQAGHDPPWHVLGPVAGLAIIEIYGAVVELRVAETAADPRFVIIFVAGGLLLAAIGVGIGLDSVRSFRIRRSLAHLAADLEAEVSGPLSSVLARSLGDDTVEVAYWIPHLQRHVDHAGRTVDPSPLPGQAVATLERSGEELGQVNHSSRLPQETLEREIGSAAQLAVDNERLRAELLAQAHEIRLSQERIVALADSTRHRLERNLHDGAQQRLLAVTYQLRLAQAAAKAADDQQVVRQLTAANQEVLSALTELRSVAHGIFPTILTDAGLVRALEALREESAVEVQLDVADVPCAHAADMAVYQLVTAVVESMPEDGQGVTVTVLDGNGSLQAHVALDEPTGERSQLTHAVDRIGAMGGAVTFDDDGLRAVVPCA